MGFCPLLESSGLVAIADWRGIPNSYQLLAVINLTELLSVKW